MRILLDTDVLLDVALAHEPFAADSTDVLHWAEAGGAAAVAWHSLTNCAYLLKDGGRPFLERLLRFVEVAPVATADQRHSECGSVRADGDPGRAHIVGGIGRTSTG